LIIRKLYLLLQLLVRLEDHSSRSAGTLGLLSAQGNGQPPLGLIMAEKGRICWASAERPGTRLSDRLLRASGISKGHIDKVFQFCARTGTPLGEHMVSLGILTRELLREALLEHTSAALTTLVSQAAEGSGRFSRFQPHPGKSYNPTFTFSSLEILLPTLRENPAYREAVPPLPAAYRQWATPASQTLAFLETEKEVLPAVPVEGQGFEGLNLADALELCRRARDQVGPTAPVASGFRPFSPSVPAAPGGWLVAHEPPYLCLYVLPDTGIREQMLQTLMG
jgi:hypothetical protein